MSKSVKLTTRVVEFLSKTELRNKKNKNTCVYKYLYILIPVSLNTHILINNNKLYKILISLKIFKYKAYIRKRNAIQFVIQWLCDYLCLNPKINLNITILYIVILIVYTYIKLYDKRILHIDF